MKNAKRKILNTRLWKWAGGVTLIELVTTMVIAVIPLSAVTVLVIGGQHSWGKTFLSANRRIKLDAENSCTIFGRIGRMSDSENTALIESSGRSERRAKTVSVLSAYGTGIEFRYWERSQQSTPSPGQGGRIDNTGRINRTGRKSKGVINLLSSTNTQTELIPTEYARFYLGSDDKLKIDYGPYPYDAMARQGQARTVVIAENVTRVKFHRTIENNVGQACVKMEITLRDPYDGKIITMSTATLMRN